MVSQLLIVGIICLGIEGIIPGFGIFGLVGVISLLSAFYLFFGAGVTGMIAVSIATIIMVMALWYVFKYLPDTRLARCITLNFRFTTKEGYVSAKTKEELVGLEGVAYSVLRPAGTGKFGTQYIDVVSEDVFIEKGTPIRIVATSGARVVVRSIESLN